MDSLTTKQQEFMLRNRSKINKILTALEPPKKEKPVVLPKLQKIEKAVVEASKELTKTAINLPKLTAIDKLPVSEEIEEVRSSPVQLKGLPRLKSLKDVNVAKVEKAKAPKTTPLPKLQRITKAPKEEAIPQAKAVSIDLPRLKRIAKTVVEQDADLGILPKDFDKVDLPRLKRIAKTNPAEPTTKTVTTELPDWVTKTDKKAKKTKSKKKAKKQKKEPVANEVKATKPAKKEEKPAKKVKVSKEDTLAEIKAQRSQLDFERIGEGDESTKDDLKKIKGLGASTEEKLNALGIYSYAQIVNLSDEDADLVTEIIGFFAGRIQRDNWNEQAKALMPEPEPQKEAPKAEPQKEEAAAAEEEATIDFDRIGSVKEGEGDDLTNIKGIGPATAKKLNDLGIKSYQQLANLKAKDEKIIADMIGFAPSRIKKDNWLKQAKKLLKEQE